MDSSERHEADMHRLLGGEFAQGHCVLNARSISVRPDASILGIEKVLPRSSPVKVIAPGAGEARDRPLSLSPQIRAYFYPLYSCDLGQYLTEASERNEPLPTKEATWLTFQVMTTILEARNHAIRLKGKPILFADLSPRQLLVMTDRTRRQIKHLTIGDLGGFEYEEEAYDSNAAVTYPPPWLFLRNKGKIGGLVCEALQVWLLGFLFASCLSIENFNEYVRLLAKWKYERAYTDVNRICSDYMVFLAPPPHSPLAPEAPSEAHYPNLRRVARPHRHEAGLSRGDGDNFHDLLRRKARAPAGAKLWSDFEQN
eukprot:CAMPEP_0184503016 /NCGR_PEP_ID=MMETSP0113_2-20130426/51633_1 /TAXON_ID=91329 /ORGANISM="Norrisiella sphaerica, Strain BC52" /LENGTH=311 /DNA_ID=CAMNT_0026892417 /DNA_START=991 /DNA_END=1925 /DNA_ORIENTATION=-